MTNKRTFIILCLALALLGATLACGESARQVLSGPLVVTGTVTGENGLPLTNAYAALLAASDLSLASDFVPLTENGAYRVEAAGGRDYILLLLPFSGQMEQGYRLHGHTPHTAYLPDGSGEITRDVAVAACQDYIFEGYAPDGKLLHEGDYDATRFAVDAADSATTDLFVGIDKGEGTPSVLNTCVPLGQTRRFFITWSVPGFAHNMVLELDDGGAGYTATKHGATVLNVNFEIARAQTARLARNLAAYRAADYSLPASVAGELAKAETLLGQAAAGSEGAARARLADEAAGLALWALESLELARAEQDIARYRQGSLTVAVVDEAGNPVEGTSVSYQQTSHDFAFGIYDNMINAGREEYGLMQEAGIEYATAGFYWTVTQPNGKINWDHIDHPIGVVDLAEMGFTIKGHALIWLLDLGLPDYVQAMSFEEMEQEVGERVGALVSHYRDQVDIWNVINEAHARVSMGGLTRRQVTALTQTGIRAIRENDPGARIIINNAFEWYGESHASEPFASGAELSLSIPAYLDQLEAGGVDYDIIGQQLYGGGLVDLFAEQGLGDYLGVPTWDLARYSMILDRLGEYGKPVHVTEQSVSSTWNPDWSRHGAGWWRRPWDEETQAEFVRQFYTIAFSKKRVEAITWWNINDRESFIAAGGLLDEDGNPKQSYYALRDLLNGWTTRGEARTDAGGQVTIRGYGGEYALTITHDGRVWRETVHVWEQQNGRATVEIEAPAATGERSEAGRQSLRLAGAPPPINVRPASRK